MSQPGLSFTEAYAAAKIAEHFGPYGGQAPPRAMSGQYMHPFGAFGDNSAPMTVTLAANIAYWLPFPIFKTMSFAGAYAYLNTIHAGANARMALAGESASGGPGPLLKDFGASSMTAAGLYGFTSTITAVPPQMAYLGIVVDSNPVMRAVQPWLYGSGVSVNSFEPHLSQMPTFNAPGSHNSTTLPMGLSGSFTFGAFTDPVAAPTATLTSNGSSSVGFAPLMALKVL